MSRNIAKDVATSIAAADKAKDLLDETLMCYFALCTAGMWSEAESVRIRSIAHMEALLDNVAAGCRRLQEPQ